MEGQYHSLRHGMTVQEVEGILGKANYHDGAETKIWTSRGGAIIVGFKYGRVDKRDFMPLDQPRRLRRPGP
jgi:hypothetical protein